MVGCSTFKVVIAPTTNHTRSTYHPIGTGSTRKPVGAPLANYAIVPGPTAQIIFVRPTEYLIRSGSTPSPI